jgi:hypothetical protein
MSRACTRTRRPLRPQLADLADDLRRHLPQLPGVIVEDKGLTLSVHYRMVEDESAGAVIREHVRRHSADLDVVLTEGKKVVEIRPAVDWNKGRAFAFLRTTIETAHGRGPAIFIGDDRTDEDAFRVLAATDCSIVVGNPPAPQHRPGRTPDDGCRGRVPGDPRRMRRLLITCMVALLTGGCARATAPAPMRDAEPSRARAALATLSVENLSVERVTTTITITAMTIIITTTTRGRSAGAGC